MQMHTGRTLAFLGDAVWSLKVREYFVDKGYEKGKDLHRFCQCKSSSILL